MPSQSTLLGVSGEHFIMSELLRRGYIAALAPVGVPNADIVVTDIEGKRLSALQVKTRRDIGSDGGWHMKEKHERIESDYLFYAFVDFGRNENDSGEVFVLPSSTVARVLRESHQKWLATPGKKGQAHKDTVMRRLLPSYEHLFGTDSEFRRGWLSHFKSAWHLLGEPQRPVEAETD